MCAATLVYGFMYKLVTFQSDPQDFVEELCLQMQLFEPEHYLSGSHLLMDYNEQAS